MRTDKSESEYAELKQLIVETKKIAEEGRRYSLATRNYVRWLQITGALKLVLIAIPIVLALIYLPPYLAKLIEGYRGLFGGTPQSNILEQFLGGQSKDSGIDTGKVQDLIKGLRR